MIGEGVEGQLSGDRLLWLVRNRELGRERVAEVPREIVHVAEHVTARARRVAVRRGRLRVVQKTPTGVQRRGRRVPAHVDAAGEGTRRAARIGHDRDRVIEAVHDVEPISRRIQHDAGRASADGELLARQRRSGLQQIGVEHPDRSGPEPGDEERLLVGRERHAHREGEALGDLGGWPRHGAVVDVRVEMHRRHRARPDDRDSALREVAADHRLEADFVAGIGVRHVQPSGASPHDHVEQDRPDVRDRAGLHRNRRIGVDLEHVVVRQAEGDLGAPVAPDLVGPLAAHGVELDDEPRRRSARRRARRRRRKTPAARDGRFVQRGRPVARMKDRRVHRRAVGRRGERARRVAEQLQDHERRPAECRARRGRIEHPDVGSADARNERLRVGRTMGAAMGRRDERPTTGAAGEYDVARLVSHEQRARHVRGCDVGRMDGDDAHAVGEMVHDPRFDVARRQRAGRDGDGLEPDGDLGKRAQTGGCRPEDRKPGTGCVDREEQVRRGHERERSDVTALEVRKRRRLPRARHQHERESDKHRLSHGPPFVSTVHSHAARRQRISTSFVA